MSVSPRSETVGTSPLEKIHPPKRPRSRTLLLMTGAVLCLMLLASFIRLAQARKTQKLSAVTLQSSLPAALAQISASRRETPASFDFSLAAANPPAVDPLFTGYYHAVAGATTLGAPLTPAYRLPQGVVQFFTSGALLLPANTTPQQWDATRFGDLTQPLFSDGQRNTATGIIQLPLLYALLMDGSKATIGNASSGLNYGNLRADIGADTLVASPGNGQRPAPHSSATQQDGGVFIAEGTLGSVAVGHIIPSAIWSYITRPDITPDGWRTDIGLPLSEAHSFTMTGSDGSTHQMVVQVFAHTALLVDQNTLDSNGQPAITRLATGLAYLETLNAPEPQIPLNMTIWGIDPWANTAVLPAPAMGSPLVHIGLNAPLTLDGLYQWVQGTLWYEVSWNTAHTSGVGWVSASATTITAPASHSPIWYSFDQLSPDLARYLASWGNHVSAAIFDETRNTYYLYNVPQQFYMASSAKVPIMLAFLTMTEQQGREPDDEELYLLTTMIENSNNDSAQALFDEIGGAPALTAFMRSLNIGNFTSTDPVDWGYSTISPLSMVQLLTLLHDGKILTATDRSLALNLMENIESDEQEGVGTSSPNGATVAMKDGWVQAPNYLWVMNTSGIVTVGHETYIIAVYTQDEGDLTTGWDITEHVCSVAGQLLTA